MTRNDGKAKAWSKRDETDDGNTQEPPSQERYSLGSDKHLDRKLLGLGSFVPMVVLSYGRSLHLAVTSGPFNLRFLGFMVRL